MILSVITPDSEVLNQDSVTYIHLKLSDGYPISIYSGHAPLVGLLLDGIIQFSRDNQKNQIEISKGIIKVENDVIRCFVENAWNLLNGLDNEEERQ